MMDRQMPLIQAGEEVEAGTADMDMEEMAVEVEAVGEEVIVEEVDRSSANRMFQCKS
jgi:hypothetical protein